MEIRTALTYYLPLDSCFLFIKVLFSLLIGLISMLLRINADIRLSTPVILSAYQPRNMVVFAPDSCFNAVCAVLQLTFMLILSSY